MQPLSSNGSGAGRRPCVDPDVFRDVIGRFASGVTVITARHADRNYGITASAVSSLSLEPPMVLVCVNRKTGTCHAISESRVFAINILDENQADIAERFARPQTDKFLGLDVCTGQFGEPLLKDVLAYLECEVVEEVTGGTHSVFLAEVRTAGAREGSPLTYFRGKFGRFYEVHDEATYRRLRKMVLGRKFYGGQNIAIPHLAHELGVSARTVYYALTRLESEGLVTRHQEDAYSVNPLDSDTLADELDTRCALELMAAEVTVGRVSANELKELRNRMSRTLLQTGQASESIDAAIEANLSFHEFTVALARNTTLLNMYRHLTGEAIMSSALRAALNAENPTARRELEELAYDHVQLTEAYEQADLAEVKRLIRVHTNRAKGLGRYLIAHSGGLI
ncbi:MAG: flavin reductase [Alicyclobacillus sp.]|nr:flavin reductase [Alicyclobacillus sp.]